MQNLNNIVLRDYKFSFTHGPLVVFLSRKMKGSSTYYECVLILFTEFCLPAQKNIKFKLDSIHFLLRFLCYDLELIYSVYFIYLTYSIGGKPTFT